MSAAPAEDALKTSSIGQVTDKVREINFETTSREPVFTEAISSAGTAGGMSTVI